MSDKKQTTASRKQTKGGRKNDAERKRLQELEAQRRREELLETFMKDKALRESRYGTLNSIKLNWQWRLVLRDLKENELNTETEAMKSKFEHLVLTKNKVTSALNRQMGDRLDDQLSESHLQQLDRLIGFQNDHLNGMQTLYELEKSKTIKTLDGEKDIGQNRQMCNMIRVSEIKTGFESDTHRWHESVMTDYQNRQDEILNQSMEDEHALRAKLELTVDRLRQRIREMLANYHANTDDKLRNYELLKARDQRASQDIDEQNAKITKLTEIIANLKRKLKVKSESGIDSQNMSENTRDRLRMEYAGMNAEMDQRRATNEHRLTQLTINSNKAIENLDTLIRKGLNILRMFYMCSKYDKHPISEIAKEYKAINLPTIEDSEIGFEVLDDFWRNYNILCVKKNKMEAKKLTLMAENEKLKCLLKEYMDGVVETEPGILKPPKTNTGLQR